MYGMLRSSLRLQQDQGEAQGATISTSQAGQVGADSQQHTTADSPEEAGSPVGTGQPSAPD